MVGTHATAFEDRRAATLKALDTGTGDRSPKGSVDLPLRSLLLRLNACHRYFSTSSCSGRISLFQESSESHEKCASKWLVVSHDAVDAALMWRAVVDYHDCNKDLVLRFEPAIIAIECATLEDATILYAAAANRANFRESGIQMQEDMNRIIVSIRCSLRLEVPVVISGKRLVGDYESFELLVSRANDKLRQNHQRIESLFREIEAITSAPVLSQSIQTSTASSPISIVIPAHLLGVILPALREARCLPQLSRDGFWIRPHIDHPTSHRCVPIVSCNRNLSLNLRGREALATLFGDEIVASFGDINDDIWFEVEQVDQPIPAILSRPKQHSPYEKMRLALYELLSVDKHKELDTRDDLPRKWERLGRDLYLFPSGSFNIASGFWPHEDVLWPAVATALGASRLGRQEPIAPGGKRCSQVELVYPRDASGWVSHIENGLCYEFDVTKSMFASGNGSERLRFGDRCCREGEVVLDAFAGIGYFSVPAIKFGKVSHVFACEWNDDTFEALERNMERVDPTHSRYTLIKGDNRRSSVVEIVRCKVDRVSLGLLPSSECAFDFAVEALCPSGGWIHVHGNVRAGEEQDFSTQVLEKLGRLAKQSQVALKASWRFRLDYVSRVKWYAPRVRHIVLDIEAFVPQQLKIDSVDIIDTNIVPLCMRSLQDQRRPVLLRGLELGGCLTKWTDPDKFALRIKEVKCNVQVDAHKAAPDEMMSFNDPAYDFEEMPFADLVRRAAHPETEQIYLRSVGSDPTKKKRFAGKSECKPSNAFSQFPQLLQEDFSPPVPESEVYSSVLRVASAGNQLWTHYDITDNLLCQIVGRKRVLLFPPTDVENLYVRSSSSNVVDVDNLYQDTFPKFANAHRIEVILEPGDVLFLPALWFHNVRPLDFSVAINLFIRHLPDSFYADRDIYCNSDLRFGQLALKHAEDASHALQRLPLYYRDFYTRRCKVKVESQLG